MQTGIESLKVRVKGEVWDDYTHRCLFATDASAYREMPLAVAYPKDDDDLRELLIWASENSVPLIPRAAGTSLAGQVVGSGLVVDTGRYMNRILEFNKEEKSVWVQPGVIRDDLNRFLKPHGLHFAPETSTSNRCMMGGMVGNNACGAHSLIHGSTRDHLLEVKGFFSDGSRCHIHPVDIDQYNTKKAEESIEGRAYAYLDSLFKDQQKRDLISSRMPWPEIRRRNTGYAIDLLMDTEPWNPSGKPLNLASLIAGSEGTLVMLSEIKLSLEELPPPETLLLCAQFEHLDEAFMANLVALGYPVTSIELIDNVILECTAGHTGLKGHRFFIKGSPAAVLIIELSGHDLTILRQEAEEIARAIKGQGYGYHFPVVTGNEINMVWELRKAGLGLLSNVEGPAKPVPVIEDTAVRPVDLPAYMSDFNRMLEELGFACVYYAHISTGELHLRPVLDLKNPEHVRLFRRVAEESARLVRKYRGSLSGEHGDGRLRGEFIPWMVGEEIYSFFLKIKEIFDPRGILNPGKITGTPPMDTSLRYSGDYTEPSFQPVFNYEDDGGFLQAVERCNGSGDCRRPWWYNGIMCPSYQASLDERLSTRGRSNLIRETLAHPGNGSPFANPALREILDQCLSCKGCKSECPSAVDMARYKAEIMHQYYKHHRMPLSVRLVANISRINRLFRKLPWLYNAALALPPVDWAIKKLTDIHPGRELPRLSSPSLQSRIRRHLRRSVHKPDPVRGSVIFFVDEFTSDFDAPIGMKAIVLLEQLGYNVLPYFGEESGRAPFSKGDLSRAKQCANRNVMMLKGKVKPDTPLIGIEPSTLLVFRDEYPDIVDSHLVEDAKEIGRNAFLIEEFIVQELNRGNINQALFTDDEATILVHGHCHQKSLVRESGLVQMLSIPEHYSVSEMKTGCCGMAGSFGMERKNYELSLKIGEQVLFPTVRQLGDGIIVAMPGTSCRQQLFDGTGRRAYHPVEILHKALKTSSFIR
jgi:FAD/FMN-containing dehydrogenase/Fe-S oxidoreductase